MNKQGFIEGYHQKNAARMDQTLKLLTSESPDIGTSLKHYFFPLPEMKARLLRSLREGKIEGVVDRGIIGRSVQEHSFGPEAAAPAALRKLLGIKPEYASKLVAADLRAIRDTQKKQQAAAKMMKQTDKQLERIKATEQ